jgi:hypothetical protein
MTTCAVTVQNKDDIKHTLAFITKYNKKHSDKPLRTVIKNTGHDWTGRSADIVLHDEKKESGSIMIHTSFMNNFKMLDDGESIWMESGVTHYPVYNFLHGLQPPRLLIGGGCPNVGPAGGYTLGGGYSWWSKKYGPMADHVTEIEGVHADGTEFVANKEQNPDLFWALRGGGFGLGVITAVTAKTLPMFENPTDFTDAKWSCDSKTSFTQLMEKYWQWWVDQGDKQQNIGRSISFLKSSNDGKDKDGEYVLDFSAGILFDLSEGEINAMAQGLMTLGKGIEGCTLDEKVKQRNNINYIDVLYDVGTARSGNREVFSNAKVKKHGSYNFAQSSIYLRMEELKDIPKFTGKLMEVISALDADAGIEACFELNMGNLYGNPNNPKKVNENPNHSMNTVQNEAFGLLHLLREIPLFYPDMDADKHTALLEPQMKVLKEHLPNGVVADECVTSPVTLEVRQKCTDDIWKRVNDFGTAFHNGARKVLHDQFPDTGSYGSLSDYDLKNGLSREIQWQKWIWGDNYDRLLEIKKQVDPNNMLTCHHCVGAEFQRNQPFTDATKNVLI